MAVIDRSDHTQKKPACYDRCRENFHNGDDTFQCCINTPESGCVPLARPVSSQEWITTFAAPYLGTSDDVMRPLSAREPQKTGQILGGRSSRKATIGDTNGSEH